ncbi:hypothetical protein [Natronohydrobacter thiooxidans]|uniref:hypothetical protein n=1 Tax=Natronohydrobacter thiooxidans TaxID=87172 RepID=UPI0008FF20C4|nr:hypothetical protein [Natronohydrobacter thiooxidans]
MRLICASNNAGILGDNLARSPLLESLPLSVIEGAASAAKAYAQGMSETSEDILIFLHHDIYLPPGWDALLRARIAEVAARDPDWALIGAYGVDDHARGWGPVWSSSLGQIVGHVALSPQPVQSFDELLIVMRRSAGLTWDTDLPGWHLYGTDIVTQARAKGLGAYACALPLIHNDGYKDNLDQGFGAAYAYLQRKWADRLPLRSPIIKISRMGHQLWRARLHNWRARGVRQAMAVDTGLDPVALAAACGWASVAP